MQVRDSPSPPSFATNEAIIVILRLLRVPSRRFYCAISAKGSSAAFRGLDYPRNYRGLLSLRNTLRYLRRMRVSRAHAHSLSLSLSPSLFLFLSLSLSLLFFCYFFCSLYSVKAEELGNSLWVWVTSSPVVSIFPPFPCLPECGLRSFRDFARERDAKARATVS